MKNIFNKSIKYVKTIFYFLVGGNFKKNKTTNNQVVNDSVDNSNTTTKNNIRPNRLWKRNKYNLTLEEMKEINDFEEKYIKLFDSEVKKGENPWKTPEELANLTGTTISNVSTVLNLKKSLVKNSKGQLNSKKVYLNNEKLSKRIKDLLNGTIE